MSDQGIPRPAALPLLVIAIVGPAVLALLLGGPGLGVVVAALTLVVIVAVAVRSRPREAIEVAGDAVSRRHILLVVSDAVDDPRAVEEIARSAGVDSLDADAEVLALAPARQGFLDRWATDVRRANEDAQRRLVVTVASLAGAEVEARGKVGDADLVQATEDALRTFPADEVIVATAAPDSEEPEAGALSELRERLPVPLRHLVIGDSPASR
jgi:hypothetical protein